MVRKFEQHASCAPASRFRSKLSKRQMRESPQFTDVPGIPGACADGVTFRDGMGWRFTTSPDEVQRLHPVPRWGLGLLKLRTPPH